MLASVPVFAWYFVIVAIGKDWLHHNLLFKPPIFVMYIITISIIEVIEIIEIIEIIEN